MAKYTDEQKLAAVKAYKKGTGGLLATAKSQGVNVASLRKWVAGFDVSGAAGVVTKKRSYYDLDFKLRVLRRVQDEGISCRQAGALFDIRRFESIAEWKRLYAAHGAAALQPGWKQEQTTMSKVPRMRDGDEAANASEDDKRSRGELLRDVQRLRMENAYLKKAQALVRSRKRSVPEKGR